MRRDLLRVFQLPAIFEILRNPRGSKGMAADRGEDASRTGPPLHHPVRFNPRYLSLRQLLRLLIVLNVQNCRNGSSTPYREADWRRRHWVDAQPGHAAYVAQGLADLGFPKPRGA